MAAVRRVRKRGDIREEGGSVSVEFAKRVDDDGHTSATVVLKLVGGPSGEGGTGVGEFGGDVGGGDVVYKGNVEGACGVGEGDGEVEAAVLESLVINPSGQFRFAKEAKEATDCGDELDKLVVALDARRLSKVTVVEVVGELLPTFGALAGWEVGDEVQAHALTDGHQELKMVEGVPRAGWAASEEDGGEGG